MVLQDLTPMVRMLHCSTHDLSRRFARDADLRRQVVRKTPARPAGHPNRLVGKRPFGKRQDLLERSPTHDKQIHRRHVRRVTAVLPGGHVLVGVL